MCLLLLVALVDELNHCVGRKVSLIHFFDVAAVESCPRLSLILLQALVGSSQDLWRGGGGRQCSEELLNLCKSLTPIVVRRSERRYAGYPLWCYVSCS